jgi:hypothetical protein
LSRAEWKERSIAWQVEPDALDSLCDYVSEGGTLASYCSKHQIKYRLTLEWLDADADRRATYDRAIAARGGALQDEVLDSLHAAAKIDPAKLYGADGSLLHPKEMDEETRASLTEVSETFNSRTQESTTKIKFTPRHHASVELGRHLGMFREKVEVTGADGAPLIDEADAVRRIAFALAKRAQETAT